MYTVPISRDCHRLPRGTSNPASVGDACSAGVLYCGQANDSQTPLPPPPLRALHALAKGAFLSGAGGDGAWADGGRGGGFARVHLSAEAGGGGVHGEDDRGGREGGCPAGGAGGGTSLVTVPSDCPPRRPSRRCGFGIRFGPLYARLAEGRNEQDEVANPSVERRLKAASGVVTNLGAALFATALGRRYLRGFDPFVPLWLAGAINVIGIGINMLTYLEAETSDG
jgi:hypothetical protein